MTIRARIVNVPNMPRPTDGPWKDYCWAPAAPHVPHTSVKMFCYCNKPIGHDTGPLPTKHSWEDEA